MSNKLIGIYAIENLVDGKKYIGQSLNIPYRFTNHKWSLNKNSHSNKHLQNAWNKYGEKNFIFYVIELCEENNLKYITEEVILNHE